MLCIMHILLSYYSPHVQAKKRTRTFKVFLNGLCIGRIHFPEMPPDATGDNTCAVCRKKHQVFKQNHKRTTYKNMPKKVKSKFRCSKCRQYFCWRKGSMCWQDWHTKKNYWSCEKLFFIYFFYLTDSSSKIFFPSIDSDLMFFWIPQIIYFSKIYTSMGLSCVFFKLWEKMCMVKKNFGTLKLPGI